MPHFLRLFVNLDHLMIRSARTTPLDDPLLSG